MPKARNYERELKGILQGDLDTIKRVTRTCSPEEKENYQKIMDTPFLLVRSAGSLGVDLVAMSGDISFPIEVKSSVNMRIRMSKSAQLKEQTAKFEKVCRKAGLFPIYAYRLKKVRGDSWRLFKIKIDEHKMFGRLKRIYDKLPEAERSRDGYVILKWDDGMPLNRFIEYIHHLRSK
ncbi:MAG: Holliday junction resolvase [Thermoplasmata archaeon]|nr:MAG: Holliday junction resolvase [Thermoplasmata archaeon]